MRILQIVEASGGGVGRHVVDLCSGLVARGVVVHLVYSPLRQDVFFSQALPRLSSLGVNVRAIPMEKAPGVSDVRVLRNLRRYVVEHGPFDIVHGHSSKGGLFSRLLRCCGAKAIVYTPHAFVTLSPYLSPLERAVYSVTEWALGRLTTALIAVSESERQEALRLRIPNDIIHVIPNGISIPSGNYPLGRAQVRSSWGLTSENVVIGFVGRFVPQKSPDVLLRAFARVAEGRPHVRLVMVGEGPLEVQLHRLANSLGISERVIWPGYVDGRLAMACFDVFALSSAYEGFAYVILEAMSLGLPVVSTRVGGTELIASGETQDCLVAVGDSEALAAVLARLVDDNQLRQRYGLLNLERIRAFSLDKMVEDTLNLYRRLTS